MLTLILVMSLPVSTTALLYARWEYRKRGRLTLLGLLLICAMLTVPNFVLGYSMKYEMPDTLLDYIGVIVGVAGLALCLISMICFSSALKILCLDADKLTLSGPYRWSRNPQYVGWFLFELGFALNDWSWWSLAALLVIATSLYLLVLVEEEHLRGVFGEQYVEFCRKIPRLAGWGCLRI